MSITTTETELATGFTAEVFASLAALDIDLIAEITGGDFGLGLPGEAGIDFDTAFVVDAHGSTRNDDAVIVPTVFLLTDPDHSNEVAPVAIIDPTDLVSNGWTILACGSVLTDAEQIMEGNLGRRVLAAPGTYAIVETADPTDFDLICGWALLRQN